MAAIRVLVADDNPPSLLFLADVLVQAGTAVTTATDGAIAVERARDGAFDLLLLDAQMPRLDGSHALARIRGQAGPSQHAVALATTADASADVGARLLAAGFAEVLIKPLGAQALRAAVHRQVPLGAPAPRVQCDALLDDDQAGRAAGGDRAIVVALRSLLLRELQALPEELRALAERRDLHALRERLHRLDASAGFCGVPALAHAAAHLRGAADASAWPDAATRTFLDACDDCMRALVARTVAY